MVIEIETTHLVGAVIAMLTFIIGRTEIMSKNINKLRTEFEIHVGIAKHKEKMRKQAVN